MDFQFDHIQAESQQEFIDASVDLLHSMTETALANDGVAILGLSGGSTPKPIYEAFGKRQLDWSNVHIFLVDDRYIDGNDPDSNQHLVRNTLLSHAEIPEEHIVFPNTELPLNECITDYDVRLRTLLSKKAPDVCTLGLGEDGHIASLFPPVSQEGFGEDFAIHTQTEKFAVKERISTTMQVIGSANQKLFFLKGENKEAVWTEMMQSEEDESRWPAKAALSMNGGVVVSYW